MKNIIFYNRSKEALENIKDIADSLNLSNVNFIYTSNPEEFEKAFKDNKIHAVCIDDNLDTKFTVLLKEIEDIFITCPDESLKDDLFSFFSIYLSGYDVNVISNSTKYPVFWSYFQNLDAIDKGSFIPFNFNFSFEIPKRDNEPEQLTKWRALNELKRIINTASDELMARFVNKVPEIELSDEEIDKIVNRFFE